MGIALVFLAFGNRGLWVIPVVCPLVTAHRIQQHELLSIVTSVRLDEILAGGTLALVYNSPRLASVRKFLTWVSPLLLLPLTLISCDILAGDICYLRPSLAAAMVGSTLCYVRKPATIRVLENRHLAYIAAISYALYLLHPMVEWGWLGSGSKMPVYAKRIPALFAIWGLAHLSTFYFEDFWIRKGKEWCRAMSAGAAESLGGEDGDAKKLPSVT